MRVKRRRSRTALAAPVLLVALAMSPLAAALLPATAAADTPSLPIQVSLTALSPLAPQAGDTLVLRGTLRNVSQVSIATPTPAWWINRWARPVRTRSATR
jgi:hypothetical protein